MPNVQMTQQAAALLKEVQRKTGLLDTAVDAAIQSAMQGPAQTNGTDPTQNGQKPLTVEQLEKILVQAMPAQKTEIQDACTFARGYHPDSKNPRFLTQILSMRIEKEHEVVVTTSSVPPRNRDPLYATFTMDPKADFMLLFNARDVDAKGNPLLMKVVVRDGADTSKIDLTRYRTATGQMPDVVKVAKNATYVETKDIDETEFSFGDPLKQVSVAADGTRELSTSAWVRPENVDRYTAYGHMGSGNQVVINRTDRRSGNDRLLQGEQLDTTPVKTFDERVRLRIAARDTLPPEAWLDTPGSGHQVDVVLDVGRGFIFEPGSSATVQFNGMALAPQVEKTDAQLLGNDALSLKGTPGGNVSLRWLLQQPVTMTAQANPNGNDRSNASKTAVDLLFGPVRNDLSIGAAKLKPLGDVTLKADAMSANKITFEAEPISDDDNDGVKLNLKLGDGFISTENGATAQGWRMSVGYTDENNKWVSLGERKVGGANSKAESFSVDINDFDALQRLNKTVEVRMFDAGGIPAQRVILPLREVVWSDA